MAKYNPFDPANGYSEEDRLALNGKCASLINQAYKNPFPGTKIRLMEPTMQASSSPSSWRMSRPRRTIRTSRNCPA